MATQGSTQNNSARKPFIEFRGVYKAYDNGTKALNDVNLKIYKGEFVFIVGASGAGKSTFIKMIIHEEKPNAGEIVVGKYRLSTMKSKDIPGLRRTMGIVFQDFRLIRDMTVFENVAFAMHVLGASKREIRKRVAYTLNIVGLGDKARNYPDELSGGEQQRVALARALVNNPQMILADEPTGNVDPNMSYEIVSLLNEINKRGTTVIMVTHEHHLVRDFGHRVVMIEDGTVVADNEIEPIIKGPADLADHMSSMAPTGEQTGVRSSLENHKSMFTQDAVENNVPDDELTANEEIPDDTGDDYTFEPDMNLDFDLGEDEKIEPPESLLGNESFSEVLEAVSRYREEHKDDADNKPEDDDPLKSMIFGDDDEPGIDENIDGGSIEKAATEESSDEIDKKQSPEIDRDMLQSLLFGNGDLKVDDEKIEIDNKTPSYDEKAGDEQ